MRDHLLDFKLFWEYLTSQFLMIYEGEEDTGLNYKQGVNIDHVDTYKSMLERKLHFDGKVDVTWCI